MERGRRGVAAGGLGEDHAAEEDGGEGSTEAAAPSMALGVRELRGGRGEGRRRRWRGGGGTLEEGRAG